MNQRVQHGGRTYEKHDRITVYEGLGTYLCSCGWATRVDGAGPTVASLPKHVELDVQHGRIGHRTVGI
ncbi:MAG: hypothetical protein H0W33_03540 [Gammaproteobacteria bacterium]|nr:hypothetical protein [Gammaproteobacteria bacterium]